MIAFFFLVVVSTGRGNCLPIIDLTHETRRREESTLPVSIWKRPDLSSNHNDSRESSVLKFRVSVPQALDHATQFREPLQAADIGVAGVGFLVDVVGE